MPIGLQARADNIAMIVCRFFCGRYPQLLLTSYAFGLLHCHEEPQLSSYFPDSAREFPFASLAARSKEARSSGSSPSRLKVPLAHLSASNAL